MWTPRGLMGAGLLVWGWQQQGLWLAIPLALIFELSFALPWRWDLERKELNRLTDVTALGFLVLMAYQFDTHGVAGIYGVLRWVPVAFFPLVVVQQYSARNEIPYTALFMSVRRAVAKGRVPDPGGLDFRLPYFAICLVSVSGGVHRGTDMLVSLAALLAWLCWAARPREGRPGMSPGSRSGSRSRSEHGSHQARRERGVGTGNGLFLGWLVSLSAVLVLGYGIQAGVVELRRALEPWVMAYLQERIRSRFDPYRAHTSLGEIGRLKLSERIVMRVEPGPDTAVPTLFRVSSFETFSRNSWLAGTAPFSELPTDTEGATWWIDRELDGQSKPHGVKVALELPRGRGLLAAPAGTYRVNNLPVDGLYRNRFGALKVQRGPGHVEYDAMFVPDAVFDNPPRDYDLNLPTRLRPLFTELVHELGLRRGTGEEAVAKVRSYFDKDYAYSLDLETTRTAVHPLEDFVRIHKRGHCEFFATATVLLLRAADIPARYATGYSVQEWSPVEKRFIVRRRHAHSWAVAYIDGRWVDVDTTPAVWAALESADRPWWVGARDILSLLRYWYQKWRWSESSSDGWWFWLIIPLAGYLLWRFYVGGGARRWSRRERSHARVRRPPSAFAPIEQALAREGLVREPARSLKDWVGELERNQQLTEPDWIHERIFPLLYRERYDPEGLSDGEARALTGAVDEWLERYQGARDAP